MPHKSLSVKVRNRVLNNQRRNSSANHSRPSLSHLLLGSPNVNINSLQVQMPSPVSISPPPSSPGFPKRNKFPSLIPADSKAFEYPELSAPDSEDDELQQLYLAMGGADKLHRRNSKPVLEYATRKSFSAASSNAQAGMRKVMRVVVVGPKKVGKTAILQQLARFNDITGQPYIATIDDTYQIQLDSANERPKEILIFHDTAGVSDFGPFELKNSIFSQQNGPSQKVYCAQFGKDKKEVPIIVVGTCADLPGRQIDSNSTALWAAREKVKLFEISARDRVSIVEVVHFLSNKYLHPAKETKFSITKRLKPEKSNAQIRSPTDILEALASKIGTDKTGPQFLGLYDDPTTFGTSSFRRKEYFLCREYGKRAARKLAEEWPTLFMFDRDQPRLNAFRPMKPMDASVVRADEKNLVKLISEKHVQDAAKLYERVCEMGKPVSPSIQLDLFRLLAYYNAENVPADEDWPGIRVFFERPQQQRNEGGVVDLLFESLEKTEEVYSIMICHLCKFPVGQSGSDSLVRAKELFSEMMQNKMTPFKEVFDWFLLRKVSTSGGAFSIFNLLSTMRKFKIKPSLKTFNNAIACLEQGTHFENKWISAKKIMVQMYKCGIQPSLTTYDLLLTSVVYRPSREKRPEKDEKQNAINLLNEILTKLEATEKITFTERSDRNFFHTALFVTKDARNHDMAHRLEKIYSSDKNEVQFFYNDYFISICRSMSMEQLYHIYIQIVPRRTSLGKFGNRILEMLESEPYWPFTKRLIEDGIMLAQVSTLEIVFSWQSILANYPTETLTENEMVEFKQLVQRLVDIWSELNQDKRLQNPESTSNRVEIPWKIL
uniref:Small ribosomal subunit protein mS39 n=1 Tax=Ditylenchus dipsaci TaxID=166011 RepID=A0A915D1I7_9BILA